MNIVQSIAKLLSVALSLFERMFPAAMAYLYSKAKIEKKIAKANYEQIKKNADIASCSDIDNPVDKL